MSREGRDGRDEGGSRSTWAKRIIFRVVDADDESPMEDTIDTKQGLRQCGEIEREEIGHVRKCMRYLKKSYHPVNAPRERKPLRKNQRKTLAYD